MHISSETGTRVGTPTGRQWYVLGMVLCQTSRQGPAVSGSVNSPPHRAFAIAFWKSQDLSKAMEASSDGSAFRRLPSNFLTGSFAGAETVAAKEDAQDPIPRVTAPRQISTYFTTTLAPEETACPPTELERIPVVDLFSPLWAGLMQQFLGDPRAQGGAPVSRLAWYERLHRKQIAHHRRRRRYAQLLLAELHAQFLLALTRYDTLRDKYNHPVLRTTLTQPELTEYEALTRAMFVAVPSLGAEHDALWRQWTQNLRTAWTQERALMDEHAWMVERERAATQQEELRVRERAHAERVAIMSHHQMIWRQREERLRSVQPALVPNASDGNGEQRYRRSSGDQHTKVLLEMARKGEQSLGGPTDGCWLENFFNHVDEALLPPRNKRPSWAAPNMLSR